jgi:hypothetical protein
LWNRAAVLLRSPSVDGLAQSEMIIASKRFELDLMPHRFLGIFRFNAQMSINIADRFGGRLRMLCEQRQVSSVNNPQQRVCDQLLMPLRFERLKLIQRLARDNG